MEYEKFNALPEEKRERIINAAMKEFLIGYKKASTDNIVRDAGISKGLLFHYFSTKEKLYTYLIDYSIEFALREYTGLINVMQTDILEGIWQTTLLKQDLSIHHPQMFEFIASIHINAEAHNETTLANLQKFKDIQTKVITDMYANADHSLFRDDFDPSMVMQLITWTVQGYAQSKSANAHQFFEKYLEEFENLIKALKQIYYKEEHHGLQR